MIAAVVAIAVLAVPTGGASLAVAGFLGVSTAVASALITVGLTLAVSFAFKALGLSAAAPSTKTQSTPTVIRQSLTDSYIIYGRRRVIYLKLVFFHAKKVGSKHYRYFVFAVAGHRCAGDPAWTLNDETVTVDGSGKVTSGTYANSIWLWFQRGLDSETANATFVSECDGNWTSAHKGNGIAAIYMKAEMTDAAVQAGFATPAPVIDGKDDIADPRDGSTGFTSNGPLVFYDWMALPREEGGFGAYADEIPDEDWISAQANVADETVEGEARYALDGIITTGAAPSEIRDAMVINMAGTYTFSGGKHLMRPGYWVPVSEVLEEADLAGPIQVSPFSSQAQAADQVLATFIDPNSNYQPMPAPTVTIGSPADANQLDLDLSFITSSHRALRISWIMLRRAQAEKTVIWPANITGLKAKALDTIQFGTTRYGLSNYAFSVGGWQFAADMGVTINGREENEDIYAEPAPVTPASVPTIAVAEPVMLERDIAVQIANSYTSPTQILSATESGGVGSIEVIAHDRLYPDGTSVSLTGGTVTGLTNDTAYYLYYDDLSRSETAPTFAATTDPNIAQSGVDRHALGRIRTPVTASGINYVGGGVLPTGAQLGVDLP